MTTGSSRRLAGAALLAAALAATAPSAAQEAGQTYFGFYEALSRHGNDRIGLNPGGIVAGNLRRSGAEIGVFVGRTLPGSLSNLAIEAELSLSGVGDRVRRGVYTSHSHTLAEGGVRLLAGRSWAGGMTYVAGGLAVGVFDYTVRGGGANIDTTFATPGYSAAIGWQVPLDESWSLRTEIRFTGYRGTDLSDGTFTTRATPQASSIRMALTRRF